MKIKCTCGELISDTTDGLPNKARFIPDKLWEQFWTNIDKAIETPSNDPKELERRCMELRRLHNFRNAYECPDCGTLHIDDVNHQLHSFTPNQTGYQSIFDLKSESDQRSGQ